MNFFINLTNVAGLLLYLEKPDFTLLLHAVPEIFCPLQQKLILLKITVLAAYQKALLEKME